MYTFTQLFWPGAKRPGGREEKIEQDPKGQHLVGANPCKHVMLPMCLPRSLSPSRGLPSLGSGLW